MKPLIKSSRFFISRGVYETEWLAKVGKALSIKWRERYQKKLERINKEGGYANGYLLKGGVSYNLRLWFTVRMPLKRRVYLITEAINWAYLNLGYRLERAVLQMRGHEFEDNGIIEIKNKD